MVGGVVRWLFALMLAAPLAAQSFTQADARAMASGDNDERIAATRRVLAAGDPTLGGFVQALLAIGFRPVALSGAANVKVVDVGIQRTLEAIAQRDGHVLLGSHDGDFIPQIQQLLGTERKVGLVGFREYVNASFVPLVAEGLEIFDLEDDARAFNHVLPRVRIIDIDRFDPVSYL